MGGIQDETGVVNTCLLYTSELAKQIAQEDIELSDAEKQAVIDKAANINCEVRTKFNDLFCGHNPPMAPFCTHMSSDSECTIISHPLTFRVGK